MRRKIIRINTILLMIFLFGLGPYCSYTLSATDFFTIVVLPDTQLYSATYPTIFTEQTQWIVDNKDRLNITFVVHVGDIVNDGNSIPQQWTNADASMDKLDNVVPYLVVPGNHDYDNQCGTRSATSYNSKFGPSRFQGYSWYGGHYSGGNENNYGFFSGDSQEFLVIGLEFCPRDEVLSWAEGLINDNPNKKVILFTHSYMYSDNTRVDSGDTHNCTAYTCGASCNNGEDIWNELVSKKFEHSNISLASNIILLLSGHIVVGSTDGCSITGRRTDCVNNQPVHQILQNYQICPPYGGDGLLRYYTFKPDENKIEAVTYSPHLDQYLTDSSNRFDLIYTTPGDVYPKATCGDGVIDIFDILTEVDFAVGRQIPTDCQAAKGNVPTGTPPDCTASDNEINIFDLMTMIDKALGRPNCIDYCLEHPEFCEE
jgi:hypothetical protein